MAVATVDYPIEGNMIMLVEQKKCMCRPSGRTTETVYSCLHVKVRGSYKKEKKDSQAFGNMEDQRYISYLSFLEQKI